MDNAPGVALPGSAGLLIGRAAEVALIRDQLRSGTVRLLTLSGVGGIGKTRLALEVARTAQAEFADGARFVELAPVREPALVASAIADSIHAGEPGRRPPLDALKRFLQRLHLLLVLDNFEHILEAGPLVSELLAACPTLTILATSRAPLRLTWEREFTLGPLELPDADLDRRPEQLLACPSVALLVERMAGVGVADSRDPDDLVAMAGICRRLDGIPLALELAAARAKVLAPPALLARLERPLELLTGGPRDTPPRHQALRNTFDWSYELLADGDQRLFRQLGVFVGGCTFEAAARVSDRSAASDIGFVDALGRLVDSSLVCRMDHGPDPEPRLMLLEPVREYALEQLEACGEKDAVLQRHAATYLELAERADLELRGPQQSEWLARTAREHGNALAALRWFVNSGDVERSLRVASALFLFWWGRGLTRVGLQHLNEVLALHGPEPPTPSLLMARASALSAAGALSYWQGNFGAADAYLHAALVLYADTDKTPARAFALITLGNCAIALGDLNRAHLLYEQSLDVYRAAADQRGIALATTNLGLVASHRGNSAEARVLLLEGASALQAAGDRRGVAFALRCLAIVHCYREDFDAARGCLCESLSLLRDVRDRGHLPTVLEASAIVAVASGDGVRALRIAGGAAALRDEMAMPSTPYWTPELTRWLDRARASVGDEVSVKAWADGLALSVDDTVAEALAANRANGAGAAGEAPPNGLTRRELEVLRMVANGNTNKEIASQLQLSIATVERHVANVYTKIGARGRADATAFAIRNGVLAPSSEARRY